MHALELDDDDTNAGLDMTNPAEACLARLEPIYSEKRQTMQERLEKMQSLAEATEAILKFYGTTLSATARQDSEDLVKQYNELKAIVGPWSDVKYRLGTQLHRELSDMERNFYRNHRGWSTRLSQKLAREKESLAASNGASKATVAGEASGDSDANLSPSVATLQSDLQKNLDKIGTASQRKFCQYLDARTKAQGHTLPSRVTQAFSGLGSEVTHVDVHFSQSIGGGSFGIVYKGTIPSSSKALAVKFPMHERTADNEFDQESRVWRLLKHKNILPLLGVCEMGEFVGLISPYISSTSWKYNIPQFTTAQNISFLRQIADALAYMHSLEIVHGDVKADNVLIDSTPSALLCDFGLSLQRQSDASRASQKGSGSGIHKDPNLVMEGQPLPKNRSSDVWAFSMTIAHALEPTGRLPMSDDSSNYSGYSSLCHRIVDRGERPQPPPEMTSEAQATWRIAERCWTIKDVENVPGRRPSMSFILDLLRRVESGAYKDVEESLKEWDCSKSRDNDVEDVVIPGTRPRHSRIVNLTGGIRNVLKRI